MKPMALSLLFLAFAVTTNVAAPALKDKKADDAARIVGHWAQESISLRGAEPGQSNLAHMFRFSTDGTCGMITRGSELPAQYTLDVSKSPRQMKWLHGTAMSEWTCLYELDGDTLKLAFVDQGTEPPKKIEPTKNLTIYSLKRVKE